MTTTFRHFESLGEYLAFAERYPTPNDFAGTWNGGMTHSDAVSLARKGWSEPRASVNKLSGQVISELSESVDFTHTARHDVTGACVDVAAFLAGEPECMIDFEMTERETVGKVVSILVNTTVNSNESAIDIVKRGAVVAALVEVFGMLGFSTIVNVEFACHRADWNRRDEILSQTVTVKSEQDAMDLDAFMFTLAHPSFLRKLLIGTMEADGFVANQSQAHECMAAENLSANIVIDVNAERDLAAKILSDPAAWILKVLSDNGFVESEGE